MSCIICKRTCGIFNIYTVYGNANQTVRDDIVEILGWDVEQHLYTTDCVCNVCMNMLDNVAKLKWRLQRVLTSENQDCKPIHLGKIWELFATFKREDDGDDGVSCTTPTLDLLVLSHSRDYNPSLEHQIELKERNRSLSRASSGVVSDPSEIVEILDPIRKKRRRKSHPRWNHRKRHITSSITSELSNDPFRRSYRRQNDTPLSDCSYISYYTVNKQKKSLLNKEKRASSCEIRTRSVSRTQEKESRCLQQLEHMKLYCAEQDCPLYFDDLDVLTRHKIVDHEIVALHYCEECNQKYTTAEHLRSHKATHSVGPLWCLMCFAEVENQWALQAHLNQHALYSVPCKYCDMSFLSKVLRENHVNSKHSDRRDIHLYRRKIILDRVDKVDSDSAVETESRVFPRFQVFMTPDTEVEVFLDELDVTADNMSRMHIDFVPSVAFDDGRSEVVECESANVPDGKS